MSDFTLLEGFDYYNTAGTGAGGVLTRWSYSGDGEYDIVAGLIGGGQCIRMGDITGGSQRVLTHALPSPGSTFSVGAFTKCNTDANQMFLRLRNPGGTTHIQLVSLTYTDIQVYAGGALVGTITGAWASTSAVVHIEVIGLIDPTTGWIEVYVDKILALTFSGDTSGHASDHTIGLIDISCGNGTGSSNQFSFDHLYFNTTAVQHGDLLIDYVPVAADTADKDWTPSTGTNNAALIDEAPVVLTDYVTGSALGNLDIYDLADLVADTTDILAVQTVVLENKTDAGDREFEVQLISSAAQIDDTIVPSLTARYNYGTISDVDPNTSAAWTYSGFNALKLGLEVTV